MPEPAVAIVGLGNMGLPMARRLLDAGFPVTGSDLAPDAREALAAAGGRPVAAAADAAGSAHVVILMLPNSAVVESVVAEIEGSLAEGTIVVDMGSSEPLRTRELAARLADRGVHLLDAPVSGGVRGAVAGRLTIMAGGDAAHIDAVRPVLAPLGRVIVAGPVGAGHAAKAINNLMSATHLWATGEGVEIGRRFGIDPAVLVDIVNGSSGRSGSSENKWPNYVLTGTFDSGFTAGLLLKDMLIALGLAEGVGAGAPLGRQAAELWTEAVDDLGPAADHTQVGRWIADHVGPDPRSKEEHPVALTSRQEEVKAEFIRVRGTWSELWESILLLDAEFLDAYKDFSSVPWRDGHNHLDDKTKELIFIAVDAAATHMYAPGVRQHVKAAFAAGATPREIMEVIELTSTLGIHAMNIGVPILVQVLVEKGMRTGPAPLDAEQERIKADFEKNRGYWHAFWNEMLELDPDLFEAYTRFSSVPWQRGTLSPKVKELVYIAFDTAATHLYVPGLKLHIENAVGYGATPQEILEVMEIASVIGIHAATTAVPILVEEAREAGIALEA